MVTRKSYRGSVYALGLLAPVWIYDTGVFMRKSSLTFQVANYHSAKRENALKSANNSASSARGTPFKGAKILQKPLASQRTTPPQERRLMQDFAQRSMGIPRLPFASVCGNSGHHSLCLRSRLHPISFRPNLRPRSRNPHPLCIHPNRLAIPECLQPPCATTSLS